MTSGLTGSLCSKGGIGGWPGGTVSDTGLSWSVRLAGVWGRAELTVTKIVLAVVIARHRSGCLREGLVLGGVAILAVEGFDRCPVAGRRSRAGRSGHRGPARIRASSPQPPSLSTRREE